MAMPLNTAQKSTTAGNIAFLLLSFPFGLLYFLVSVIGFTLGLSTLVIWIGIPILFATVATVRGMAATERGIVASLLRVPFPHQPHIQGQPRQTFTRRFGNALRDPLTWTSTIYMILKLPLGIISFTLALVLPILAVATTLMPLAYLINLLVNVILLRNGIQSTSYIIPYFIEVHGTFDPVMFARSFIGVPIGLALWFVTRFLLNGLALLSGEMARALLSPADAYEIQQPHPPFASPASEGEQHAYAYRD
jgi:hypothetical protein